MTLETEQPNITRKSQLIGYVRHRVMLLQKGSQEHRSGTLGDLARLRRMQRLNSDPRLWRVIFEDMPVALLGRDTAPSTAEQAVQASLGLFAVHEQSTPSPVHVQGIRFGSALHELAYRLEPDDNRWRSGRIARRFHSAALADDWDSRLYHLRGLMTLLRGEHLPLDYGLLAWDLDRIQRLDRADAVRMQWGRDFQYRPSTTIKETN